MYRRRGTRIAKLGNVAQNLTMPEVETLGARIKRFRLQRGMTQRDLAQRVGVGVPYISKIESGRERPGDEVLLAIAESLGDDPDELFLVARRLPPDLVDQFAASPADGVRYLRSWSKQVPSAQDGQ